MGFSDGWVGCENSHAELEGGPGFLPPGRPWCWLQVSISSPVFPIQEKPPSRYEVANFAYLHPGTHSSISMDGCVLEEGWMVSPFGLKFEEAVNNHVDISFWKGKNTSITRTFLSCGVCANDCSKNLHHTLTRYSLGFQPRRNEKGSPALDLNNDYPNISYS